MNGNAQGDGAYNELPKEVRVGTRESPLALKQTEWVIEELSRMCPVITFVKVPMKTIGDKILDKPLAELGKTTEKGLFLKELEEILLLEKVDFVVHSLKDMPTQLAPEFTVATITKRHDPRDAVIFNPKYRGMTLATMPAGSKVGTSSLRRIAQLKHKYPHLDFGDMRGNLNTRLRKLDAEDSEFAALILAVAGISRLGWEDRIGQVLDCSDWKYAVGQGSLAIECLGNNNVQLLRVLDKLNDPESYLVCLAERAFLRSLEGGCSVPIGVSSGISRDGVEINLTLQGSVWSLDGTKAVSNKLSCNLGPSDESEDDSLSEISCDLTCVHERIFPGFSKNATKLAAMLGKRLGQLLEKQGAKEILAEVRNVPSLAAPSRQTNGH